MSIIDDKISKDQEVAGCFNIALKRVKEYKQHNNLICSDKVEFGGIIDDVMNPISLALGEDKYILYYSSHYFDNPADKIINTIVRYIVAGNDNFTFKNNNQIREELQKIPDGSNYESSFRNNYLICDEPVTDAVICNSCLRIYRCSKDSDMFQNFNTYRCDCGGTLSVIENGERKTDIYNSELYQDISLDTIKQSKKERKQKESMEAFLKTPEDFDEKYFDEDVLDFINEIIIAYKNRISRLTINDFTMKNIDNKTALVMLNTAFPKAYYNFYKYSKNSIQRKLLSDIDTRPIYQMFDYNAEIEKMNGKERSKARLSAFNDIANIIEHDDLSEQTKKDLAIAFENKGKKISRMKIAEYVENSVVIGNSEFIEVINKYFPDIYLESIKHVHKPIREYLYEHHVPNTANFNDDFKKKYPPSKYKKSLPLQSKPIEVKTVMDKLKNFIMAYPKVGNKELSHEINDAAFHTDAEYLVLLKQSFPERFEKVRHLLPLSTINFLKENMI